MTRLTLAALVGVVLAASACGNASNTATDRPAWLPKNATEGELVRGHIDGQQTYRNGITADRTYCRWSGGSVQMVLRFTNSTSATLNADLTPHYEIQDGGWHGDSWDSQQTVTLAPNSTEVRSIDAGSPDGITPGTAIATCAPNLDNVDAG